MMKMHLGPGGVSGRDGRFIDWLSSNRTCARVAAHYNILYNILSHCSVNIVGMGLDLSVPQKT